jgi:hypothetical protein
VSTSGFTGFKDLQDDNNLPDYGDFLKMDENNIMI